MEHLSGLTCPVMGQGPNERSILLIDGDASFRKALASNLGEDGYHVAEFAADGDLPPLGSLADVRLVIVEYRSSDGDGFTFADGFHAAYPTTPIIMLTTFWADYLGAEAKRRRFLQVLHKPFGYDELLTLVERVCCVRVVQRGSIE